MENHHKRIIIPHDRLSMEALQGLIEEFVTRDGTDTGYTDGIIEMNVEMVMRQLKRGDVLNVVSLELQLTFHTPPRACSVYFSFPENSLKSSLTKRYL